jgi:ArsR family transcriptional regulator, arsenate/arsenite/antimonite-responsive transcriptional repressor
MQQETAIFKALSDPTRLRLAVLLAIRGETCVCKLAAALGEKDYNVSRHLGILRAAGLVETRRDGLWMYYRLTDNPTPLKTDLFESFRNNFREDSTVLGDLKRMDEYGVCASSSDSSKQGDCCGDSSFTKSINTPRI